VPGKEEERMLVTVFDKKINIAKVDQEDTLAFGFDTMTLLPMTTTVLQQTTTLRGVGRQGCGNVSCPSCTPKLEARLAKKEVMASCSEVVIL